VSSSELPEILTVAQPTVEVLQDLQVILGVADHPTPGSVLEATLLWYDDATSTGSVLHFRPPENQHGWLAYSRSLGVEASPPNESEAIVLRIEGEALRRLAGSEFLLGVATSGGIDQIVRLRAEHAFRSADDWRIDVTAGEIAQ
jgi:hypothetical protein